MIEYAIREYLEHITGMDVSPAFTYGPFPAMTYKISPYNEGAVKECKGDQWEHGRVFGNS